ncbi:MAG: bifunctional 5,10-methylenetetrahydrofolate dehydrogenase/5,10-methenyltetrahydrofolate cyclohydrolase [Stellaceae bacterium]
MAEAHIIDGRALAAALRLRVAEAAAQLKSAHGIVPGLATLLVGDDPASLSYIRSKGRAAGEAGLASREARLPADTTEAAVLAEVARLGADEEIDAILVQLPLPPQIAAHRVIAAVDPQKDVDGFHPLNVGRLWSGLPGLVPCTPQACLRLLRSVHADLSGAEVVVVGRSNIVGKPVAALLLAAGCTVTMVHSRSRDAAAICRRADILVAAAGRAHLITAEWIKPGATVLDVGISPLALPDGRSRIVGDVDPLGALAIAGALTPVPGGVGPMTIACVLANTLLAACRRRGLPDPAM